MSKPEIRYKIAASSLLMVGWFIGVEFCGQRYKYLVLSASLKVNRSLVKPT
jgi:hypothetical protein